MPKVVGTTKVANPLGDDLASIPKSVVSAPIVGDLPPVLNLDQLVEDGVKQDAEAESAGKWVQAALKFLSDLPNKPRSIQDRADVIAQARSYRANLERLEATENLTVYRAVLKAKLIHSFGQKFPSIEAVDEMVYGLRNDGLTYEVFVGADNKAPAFHFSYFGQMFMGQEKAAFNEADVSDIKDAWKSVWDQALAFVRPMWTAKYNDLARRGQLLAIDVANGKSGLCAAIVPPNPKKFSEGGVMLVKSNGTVFSVLDVANDPAGTGKFARAIRAAMSAEVFVKVSKLAEPRLVFTATCGLDDRQIAAICQLHQAFRRALILEHQLDEQHSSGEDDKPDVPVAKPAEAPVPVTVGQQ
jgi:hypothetical protein